VTLSDFSILNGGHFAILAPGTDNLTIDNLKIDTNRYGIDVDACRNVRISNTSVNAPNDDAIVLKSSYALGAARATENVTIANCFVSGYDIGSLLDATYKRNLTRAPDRDGPTGRVKLGTESNGGFRKITITNVVFDRTRGLALETVDGGPLEDITASNLSMRDVSNSPLFIRLGVRMRAPAGTLPGSVRRVGISNVVVCADPRYASIISGVPGQWIEGVRLSDIRILYRGGLSLDDVARQPADMVNTFFFRDSSGPLAREPFATPEREKDYPEPSVFGLLPAYGFFVRHVRGIEFHNVEVGYMRPDRRPAFVLEDVTGASFHHLRAQKPEDSPYFVLRDVGDFALHDSAGVPDTRITDRVARREM